MLLSQVRRAPQQCTAQMRKYTTTGSMHILGISGSIRKGSYNTKMLLAAQKVNPVGCRTRPNVYRFYMVTLALALDFIQRALS